MQRAAEDPSWRSVEVEDGPSAVVERGLIEDPSSAIDNARFRKAVRHFLSENARLRSVLGHCPKGIALLDEHGKLCGFNREFVALLGKEPTLGEPMFEHFPATDRELLRTVIQRAGTTRKAAAVVRIEQSGSGAREIEFLAATLPSNGDRSIGVVLAGEDRTAAVDDEHVRLTLDDANQRDAFALAMVAVRRHADELRRTALAALRAVPTNGSHVEIEQAIEALEAQAKFVSVQLPERISIRPPGVTEIGAAARRAARLSWVGRARRRVTVDVQIDEPLKVLCAETDLVQVLTNVLASSVQSVEEADRFGWITVGAEVVGASVEIAIRDNGRGLAPHALQQALQSGASDQESAQGLGLAIAKTIVEACGGSIRALSEPDRGTTIVISLPRAEATVSDFASPS